MILAKPLPPQPQPGIAWPRPTSFRKKAVRIVGSLATAAALWFAYQSIPKKDGSIAVSVTYVDELLERVRAVNEKRLVVAWEDELGAVPPRPSIQYFSIFNVAIKNTGDLAFKWERVTQPLTFKCGADSIILGIGPPFGQVEERQSKVQLQLAPDRKSVTVTTDYLNPSETIRFAIYHNAPTPTGFKLSTRIVDQPTVSFVHNPEVSRPGVRELVLKVNAYSSAVTTLTGFVIIGIVLGKQRASWRMWPKAFGWAFILVVPPQSVAFLLYYFFGGPGSTTEVSIALDFAGLNMMNMGMLMFSLTAMSWVGVLPKKKYPKTFKQRRK